MDTIKLAWNELPAVTNAACAQNSVPLFVHRRMRWALRELWFGVSSGEVCVLTAPAGCGKTTLCESLLHRIPQNFYAVHLPAAEVACADTFERLANSLTRLRQQYDARQTDESAGMRRQYRLALVLDDAHRLEPAVLERLANFRDRENLADGMVAVLLIGEPSLEGLLRSPALQRFNAQVALRCHLSALTFDDGKAYIHHWFNTHVGIRVHLTESALRIVQFAAAGIPGNLEAICKRAWQYMRRTGKYSITSMVATRAAWTLLVR